MVGTVCARFNIPPSEYLASHDWVELSIDYEMATTLNKIDQEKKEQEYKMLYGAK